MKWIARTGFWALLLAAAPARAQTETTLTQDPQQAARQLTAIQNRYQKDIGSLSGPHKKQLADIYKERFESIREKFTENEVLTDARATAYLQAFAQAVLRANPALPAGELRVLFSRAWWPNASSMGEGTILFNIGLFHRLGSEAQAAFVLCHELAHYYLNHGNNAINKYVQTLYSEDFQKQLKQIQKTEYGKNRQLEGLAKGFAFGSRRHSREHEQQADSMALVLMKNAGYDLNEALSCLALLDAVDEEKFPAPLNLHQKFDFPAHRFKKSWTESDVLAFTPAVDDVKAKAEKDSLKTHPDCTKRIEKLAGPEKLFPAGGRKFIVDEKAFRQLQTDFDFEILNYCFDAGRISRCLYLALKMTDAYPGHAAPPLMVGKCLNELYLRQKTHELGKVADLPNTGVEKEYNGLLHFIQNTRLRDLAAISYYYLQAFESTLGNHPEFSKVFAISKSNFTK